MIILLPVAITHAAQCPLQDLALAGKGGRLVASNHRLDQIEPDPHGLRRKAAYLLVGPGMPNLAQVAHLGECHFIHHTSD